MTAANPAQVALISEMVWNLLYHLPITAESRKALLRKKGLKDVANFKRTLRFRKVKIIKHLKDVIDILEKYHKKLMHISRKVVMQKTP